MNSVVEEMKKYIGISKEANIQHTGTPQEFPFDPHGSGRYREGSGENPYQHGITFLQRVDQLKKQGWKETKDNIEKEFGMSTTQYRREVSILKKQEKNDNMARAYKLSQDGHGSTAIGNMMGVSEGTVRDWLRDYDKGKANRTVELADQLKTIVDKKKMVDVGKGVENDLQVPRSRLDTAIQILEKEGYHRYQNGIPQPTNPGQKTTQVVLTTPDKTIKDIYNWSDVKSLKDYISRDGGKTIEKRFHYPASMDSDRVSIRYAEDGGEMRDGIVEIRRGKQDLDLRGNHYAQVRILVDGDHYIKGMAVYADPEEVKKWPKGTDIMFNTSKHKDIPKMEVLKPIKDKEKSPDNPFGATIKDAKDGGQYWYIDNKDGKRKLGLINSKSIEGDWSEWKDKLASQFLSKQSTELINRQLNLSKNIKKEEYNEILSLTNPTVKKYYLEQFANDCDKEAKDLKAAALPGQKYKVILPLNEMGDNKIYAPTYTNGTRLALVRYPHAGLFEIPVLTVDNNNKTAKKLYGNMEDGVLISSNVAKQLSGADFDGDTVMCIPTDNGKVKIAHRQYLKELKNWDMNGTYGPDPGEKGEKEGPDKKKHYYRNGVEYKIMTEPEKQKQMGIVSNLITDMTLQGASDQELARAVKHSMVVIDAPKHKLDYEASFRDNNIQGLKDKYQPKWDKNGNKKENGGGAATIISRAKNEERVDKRRGEVKYNMKGKSWYNPNLPEGAKIYNVARDSDLYYIDNRTYDKETGLTTYKDTKGNKIIFNRKNKEEYEKYNPVLKKDDTGKVYFENKNGDIFKATKRKQKSTQMDETNDARSLMLNKNDPKEQAYADYANSMKALANTARKEYMYTKDIEYNREAARKYSKEVGELESGLNLVQINKPKERQALRLANAQIDKVLESKTTYKDGKKKYDMTDDEIKKLKQQTMTKYRDQLETVSRKNRMINITDKQWEAIQSGAIPKTKLNDILQNSDPDLLREKAMPKEKKSLSASQITRIKAMYNTNQFTIAEIALKMHVSPSVVSNYVKGEKNG